MPTGPPESTRDGSRDFDSYTSPFPLGAGVNPSILPLLSKTKLGTQSLEHSQGSGEKDGVAPHSPSEEATKEWSSDKDKQSAKYTGTGTEVHADDIENDEATNVLETAKVQNKYLLFPIGYHSEDSQIGGSRGFPESWEPNHLDPQALAGMGIPRSKGTKRDTSQPKSVRQGADINGGGTTIEPASEELVSLWYTHYPELRMYIPAGTQLALTDLITIRNMVIADREREASTTHSLLGRAVPGLVAATFEQGHLERTGTQHHRSGGTRSFDREQTRSTTSRSDKSGQGQESPSLSKKGPNSVDNDEGLFTTAQVNRLAEARSRSVEEFEAMKSVFRAANHYMINDVEGHDIHRSGGIDAISIKSGVRFTSQQNYRYNTNVESDKGMSPDSMASEHQQGSGRAKGTIGVAPSTTQIQGTSPYGSRKPLPNQSASIGEAFVTPTSLRAARAGPRIVTWTRPDCRIDTFQYRETEWFSLDAMANVPSDQRWRTHLGRKEVCPLDQEYLPSENPSIQRPVGLEGFEGTMLPFKGVHIVGETQPLPHDGVGDFRRGLNKLLSWMSRAGYTQYNWLRAFVDLLVVEQLRWRVEAVLNDPKVKAYCYMVGTDECSHLVSYFRLIECVAYEFVPKDDGSTVQLWIDQLRAPIEGDHFDVHYVLYESKRLVRILPGYMAQPSGMAYQAKVVEVMKRALERTHPGLALEWSQRNTLRRQVQHTSSKLGATLYEHYNAEAENMRRANYHLETKPSSIHETQISNQQWVSSNGGPVKPLDEDQGADDDSRAYYEY